jgi:hypothetical protein
MDLRLDIELREGLLLATASGDVTLEAAARLLKEACDLANEKRVSKILVTALAVNGELSTLERYDLGTQVAQYIQQRHLNVKMAFLGKRPTTDGFGARVAQNRGMVVEVFYNEQEAMNWLASWPS